jgi:hypothetical protein
LAGCERLSKTGATGIRAEEGKMINLSLTYLRTVIDKLSQNKKDDFIPYNNSKLTKLLKDSLGGNSKTTLVCTCSRKREHLEETIQSLEFVRTVKKIQTNAKINIQRTPQELQATIDQLQK